MPDEIKHVIGGIAGLACALALFALLKAFGMPAALFAAGAALGLGVELYQWLRREGQPSARDAFLSALPCWAAAAALKIAGSTGF